MPDPPDPVRSEAQLTQIYMHFLALTDEFHEIRKVAAKTMVNMSQNHIQIAKIGAIITKFQLSHMQKMVALEYANIQEQVELLSLLQREMVVFNNLLVDHESMT
jgi:hypothetical protein